MNKKVIGYHTDFILSFVTLMVVGGLCLKGMMCMG